MVKKASIAICLIVVAVALAALFYFADAKFENKMSKFWLLSAIVCMALAGGQSFSLLLLLQEARR